MPAMAIPIDRERIEATHEVIRPWVRRTPVLEVGGADFEQADVALVLKLELLQHAGSFKPRGAFANLLLRKVPAAGVVAASGGNHGAAVAYAAKIMKDQLSIITNDGANGRIPLDVIGKVESAVTVSDTQLVFGSDVSGEMSIYRVTIADGIVTLLERQANAPHWRP